MLLLNCSMHDFVAARATGIWLLRARRGKTRLLSSYNSNSPQRGTAQLCGDG
jgi:hypothetical protein